MESFIQDLPNLENILYDCSLYYYFNGLSDSSFEGMADNVCIRTVDYQVQIHVKLIMAKYRVAFTLDHSSLTRLKLFAAYLLSEF